VTESSTQRRKLISVVYVTETIHPAGDLPEHSTRQGLVRFARVLFKGLVLDYFLRFPIRYAMRYAIRYAVRYTISYALCYTLHLV